ncbi:MAG: hypothetical protein WC449_02840 [Candidatus Paceibacterota bacterium]
MKAMLNGVELNLRKLKHLGEGGEADIYQQGKLAVKIFKPPGHPDFSGFPEQQQAAKIKLLEIQKKLPLFPKGLSNRVIAPLDFVYNEAGEIIGYAMALVSNGELLLKFSDKIFRDRGVSNTLVKDIFLDLRSSVELVHRQNIVIGDFNDLNVMVVGSQAFLIDADSWQYGGYMCRLFTERLIDPLLLDANAQEFCLAKPESEASDWYSFDALLMQSYLLAGPYAGVHKPPKGRQANSLERRLKRITVFDKNVLYPKTARPLKSLSDDLLARFEQVFLKDKRQVFPENLLKNAQWTTCSQCGFEHARSVCPNCTQAVPKQSIQIQGNVTATQIFSTNGVIICSTVQNGELKWLFHEIHSYYRENDQIVLVGVLDPYMRLRIWGDKTIFGKQDKLVIASAKGNKVSKVDCLGSLPIFDANSKHLYWCEGGKLWRSGDIDEEVPIAIGSILESRTLFWVGEQFGLGFYRAQGYSSVFVFDAEKPGINDAIKISFGSGQILDTTAIFSHDHCWFFCKKSQAGKIENHCWLVSRFGQVLGHEVAVDGSNNWLGAIRGKCALTTQNGNEALLCATDQGIVRVDYTNGQIAKARDFAGTENFVDSQTQLYLCKDGLIALNKNAIRQIKIS